MSQTHYYLKSLSLDKSQGDGGYHVVAFMLFIFIYLYIHVYIHTSFFYSDQVFTLAILGEYSALCQCAYGCPAGSCVELEGRASGPGT